jgi:hypothetical protein
MRRFFWVASLPPTKTYIGQLLALYLLAIALGVRYRPTICELIR